jgi:hypothetical protein
MQQGKGIEVKSTHANFNLNPDFSAALNDIETISI